jgi:hypothetical protein
VPKTAPSKTPPAKAEPARARPTWGRWLRIAVPVVGLTATAVAITLTMRHDDNSSPTFSPAAHQVTYEVSGTGTAPEINYSVGTAAPILLHQMRLPWQTVVEVTVGVGGGVVNLDSAYPRAGGTSSAAPAPLICRILVDGKLTAQRTSTNGFTDAACSAAIRAKQD